MYVIDNPYDDNFDLLLIKETNDILINRIDKNAGWNFDLKINFKNVIHNVGRSVCSYKILQTNVPIEEEEEEEEKEEEKEEKEEEEEEEVQKLVFFSNTVEHEDFDLCDNDKILVITSMINLPIQTHNIINKNIRFNQTISQLIKYKKYFDKIILCEQSIDISSYTIKKLQKYATIVLFNDDKSSNFFSSEQIINKGLGEMYVTKKIFQILSNSKKQFTICKAVGRYIPTSKFDIEKFDVYMPTFKAIAGGGRQGIIVYTNLYSLPSEFLKIFVEFFNIWLNTIPIEPIEHIMTMFVESLPKIKLIDELCIYGYNAKTNVKKKM